MGLDRIAQPFQAAAVGGGDGQARDKLDRAGVGMVARQEFWIEQGKGPGRRDRNGLAHADDAAVAVGDVGLVADHAGKGRPGRSGNGRLGAGQGQDGVFRTAQDRGLGQGRGGGEQGEDAGGGEQADRALHQGTLGRGRTQIRTGGAGSGAPAAPAGVAAALTSSSSTVNSRVELGGSSPPPTQRSP